MTDYEFLVFKKSSMEGYKNDKIRANGFTDEEASEVAKRDLNQLLITCIV
jgi:hypothetical protein